MEHGDCFSSCIKIGEKTINVKGKVGEEKDLKRKEIIFYAIAHAQPKSSVGQVTGDFIVEELDVDGSLASRMKQILVRQ